MKVYQIIYTSVLHSLSDSELSFKSGRIENLFMLTGTGAFRP